MNIDEMKAGHTLDLWVAQAMGRFEDKSTYWISSRVDGIYVRRVAGGDFVRFAPSTDIAAAWEVVQVLNQQGYTLRLTGPEIPDTTGYLIEKRWSAAFVEPQYAFTNVGQRQGRGSTPSLAICYAALKVMAEESNQ